MIIQAESVSYNDHVTVESDVKFTHIVVETINTAVLEVASGGASGPQGVQGDPGLDGDKTFVHTEVTAKLVWTINHNMNKYPTVRCKDSAGTHIEGEVEDIDLNNLTITYYYPTDGVATLN